MKLLLTSSGITNDAIERALVELAGKAKAEISFAVINEAYAVEQGSKRWIIEELAGLAARFKGSLDFVDLLALDAVHIQQRLNSADAIYVLGGHTDYLQSVLVRSGLAAMLPELLTRHVYVGSSVGSMVMGKRVSSEAYAQIYGEKGDYGTEAYMEFVDFSLNPHLNSPELPNNTEAKLGAMLAASADRSFLPLYAIDDATVIQVVDDERTVISKGTWKLYE